MTKQKSYNSIWEYWHNEKKTIQKNCSSACFSCNKGELTITHKDGSKIFLNDEMFQVVKGVN